MCGIAGVLSAGPVSERLLHAMAGRIAHRGPDDEGVWSDPAAGIGFAHRRLSILDLSPQGHQPMASADERLVINYNGELYNHAALRSELDEAGATPEAGWRGHSDTETLLQAIAIWGLERALAKAVGMFAFALWDSKERTLRLVRDRFGEKPLYYGWAGRDFVFGSELKTIGAHPDFAGEIDRQSLAEYAAKTYIPAPRSIYRGIFKLPPGTILTVRAPDGLTPRTSLLEEGRSEGGLSLDRYWSYRDLVERGLDDPISHREEALAALEATLGEAVRGQSMADVPVGAFLSGGIDSSTIVALYQKHNARPVRTFSIGFEEAGYNEADHARAVAAFLKTEHHERVVTVREAREVIPLLPAMYDEPFADSSQIPTYLVSRFAREQVTVALTGDGGDELFGGYNRHVMAPRLWDKLGRVPRPVRAIAGRALGAVPASTWSRARGHPQFGAKVQKGLRVAGAAREFGDVYASFLDEWRLEASPVQGANDDVLAPDLAVGGGDAVAAMYADAVGYLPDDILCKVDRASMAVSLETRVPFLDHRVVELAARIPIGMKVRGGTGKRILRELLGRHLPPALFERPKAGFAVPVGEWIKGPLRPWAEDLLDSAHLSADGLFDADVVHHRWRQHLSGERDSTPAIWAVLMFQAWKQAGDA